MPIVIGLLVVILVVVLLGVLAYLGTQIGPLVGRTALADLTVGQCFNGAGAAGDSPQVLFAVEVVDSAEPHTSELVATFDYLGGGA